ncbi:MAG: phosphatidylglycerophosphatase A [Terriglobia bacterium]|nr:MAG: phosphatidylglycerophosphatase A [Terriglobia bacterium]
MTNRTSNSLANLVSTWFGCGYVPIAPGTAGSFAALAIAIGLREFARFSWWQFLILAAAGFLPAVWAATRTARELKLKDPRAVVVDEVLGQWIAVAGAHPMNWKSYAAAFFLFRLFDVWKPPPIRRLEAFPEGWGIVADDLLAGVYAALVLSLAGWFNLY